MEVIAEDVTSDSGKSLRMEHHYDNDTLALSWCYSAEFQLLLDMGARWTLVIHHSLK